MNISSFSRSAVMATMIVGLTYAQPSDDLKGEVRDRNGTREIHGIEFGPRERATSGKPDLGGRDRGGPGSSRDTGAVQLIDQYPALTRANNAYKQAVAVWQRAYNSYQIALQEQTQLRDKYVDANGNIRAGWDSAAAQAVVHAADVKAWDAYYELQNAEKARNEAHSRATQELTRAWDQYSRAEAARVEAATRATAAKEAEQKAEDKRYMQSVRSGGR